MQSRQDVCSMHVCWAGGLSRSSQALLDALRPHRRALAVLDQKITGKEGSVTITKPIPRRSVTGLRGGGGWGARGIRRAPIVSGERDKRTFAENGFK